jgi:hypothetical protein
VKGTHHSGKPEQEAQNDGNQNMDIEVISVEKAELQNKFNN